LRNDKEAVLKQTQPRNAIPLLHQVVTVFAAAKTAAEARSIEERVLRAAEEERQKKEQAARAKAKEADKKRQEAEAKRRKEIEAKVGFWGLQLPYSDEGRILA